MLNRFFGKNFHDYFHLFGISALAVGLPTSKVILSLAMMLLLLNILLESKFKTYWHNIRTNKLFLILAAYWGLHIIGLIWSSDMNYAMNDIRIKLTLLVIPLIFTSKPITNSKHVVEILLLFVTTLVFTSLFNYASYFNWIGSRTYSDFRELSLFGSHIRYGILISLAAGISLYYLWKLESRTKWLLFPVFIWLCYYTYFSQIISGLLALIVVILFFGVFFSFSHSKKTGFISVIVLCILAIIPVFMLTQKQTPTTELDIHNLESHTPFGNPYTHNLDSTTVIDGKPIFAYVSEIELEKAWHTKSKLSYFGEDERGQPLRYTLMRYMTSKNLRKDGSDFKKLTKKDIRNIESGIASVEETSQGFRARLTGIKFQLYNTSDPNGHSLLQRLEYWKTAWQIIKRNYFLGVGTGDVQLAFDKQYEIQNSPLLPENRLRAHNTYLTSWISFGVFGLMLFLWMNLAFLIKHWKAKSFIPTMFILVALCTFFIEDTLETQMGVTFFAFFYGLFILPSKELNN